MNGWIAVWVGIALGIVAGEILGLIGWAWWSYLGGKKVVGWAVGLTYPLRYWWWKRRYPELAAWYDAEELRLNALMEAMGQRFLPIFETMGHTVTEAGEALRRAGLIE